MRFSGIPSGSKSIETLPLPPGDDFIIVHTCDISFDQSTRSVLALLRLLVIQINN